MEPFTDAIVGWSTFWLGYYVFSFAFDKHYKTLKNISDRDLQNTVFENMIVTGITHPIFYLLIPNGFLNPQFTIYRFMISMILTEIIFFYSHKLFHTKLLYKFHEKHHLFIKPSAFSALYCSTAEMVFCNQLSTIFGPIISGMNIWELSLWSLLCALNVLKAHSGSRLPFFNSRYHDLHHEKRKVNFGFLYVLDIIHGSCELPKVASL
jgi:sterol desaturase/sphingolipid hydroxylase (fatty acid hydroxylase superfamily)